MRPLLILALVAVMACIGGVVWAKAIYVPRPVSAPAAATILLHTGGSVSLHSGGLMACHTC